MDELNGLYVEAETAALNRLDRAAHHSAQREMVPVFNGTGEKKNFV